MASSSHVLVLRLSVLLGVLAIAANARPGRHFHPCNTLILFSTSSASSFPLEQNPDFSLRKPSFTFSARRSVTFFFTEVKEVDPEPTFLPSYPSIFVDRARVDDEKRPLPFGLYSSAGASYRDRAVDILSVVGSLLFGVGCGALTAATLYMIWSLFAYNRFDYRDSDDEFDDEDDDVSPKKMGYVAIPAAEAPLAAPQAKEVV